MPPHGTVPDPQGSVLRDARARGAAGPEAAVAEVLAAAAISRGLAAVAVEAAAAKGGVEDAELRVAAVASSDGGHVALAAHPNPSGQDTEVSEAVTDAVRPSIGLATDAGGMMRDALGELAAGSMLPPAVEASEGLAAAKACHKDTVAAVLRALQALLAGAQRAYALARMSVWRAPIAPNRMLLARKPIPHSHSGNLEKCHVPPPRSAGAVFGGCGVLVYFRNSPSPYVGLADTEMPRTYVTAVAGIEPTRARIWAHERPHPRWPPRPPSSHAIGGAGRRARLATSGRVSEPGAGLAARTHRAVGDGRRARRVALERVGR